MKRLIAVFSCCLAVAVQAQNLPIAMKTDSRIKQVTFRENDVVPIKGTTLATTEIQFGTGEKILDIEGGDTTAWMVTHHPELSNILFIKPTQFNSSTNLTVITDRHSYYFHLKSNRTLEASREQTWALKFIYPPVVTQQRAPARPQEPKVVNAAYRFSGSTELLPIRVFDDGKFTYFELNHQGAVPAIFAVDDKNGKESTVNTRRQGKYLIVTRIAPQFSLRNGKLVTSVFNVNEISRIKQNRRPA